MRLYHYLRKRGLALFMALVLCLSLLPAQAMAGDMAPLAPSGGIAPEPVEYDGLARTEATITYVRPRVLSQVNVVCVVDNSAWNRASQVMSPVLNNLSGLFGSSGAQGTTIAYSYTPVVTDGLSGGFGGVLNAGQPHEVNALEKAIEKVNETQNGKTPVVFWVPGPQLGLIEGSRPDAIQEKLDELQAALDVKGGTLITWQMAEEADPLLTGHMEKHSNVYVNTAGADTFREEVSASLEAVFTDYYKDLQFQFPLVGELATAITSVSGTARWGGSIGTPSIDSGGRSATLTIPKLYNHQELVITVKAALDATKFEKQTILKPEATPGTFYSNIFDTDSREAGFQLQPAEADRAKRTISFYLHEGDTEAWQTSEGRLPGEFVPLPDARKFSEPGKSFGGWRMAGADGTIYTPGQGTVMPEESTTMTALWGGVRMELRIGGVDTVETGNQMMDTGGPSAHWAFKHLSPLYFEKYNDRIVSISVEDAKIDFEGECTPGNETITIKEINGTPVADEEIVAAKYVGKNEYNRVIAYVKPHVTPDGAETGTYDLVVAAEGGVKAAAERPYQLFSNFPQLTDVDVSRLDTSAAKNLFGMFWDCPRLETVDVSSWNTSNVTNGIGWLFNGCKALKTVDLSSWDVSRTNSTREMFQGCSNLESVNLSGWDTSNVLIMTKMFENCSKLKELDLSHFNTSKVGTDTSWQNEANSFQYMFSGCSSLEKLNLSGWDTSHARDMRGMFFECRSLTELDLSSFDTSGVTNPSKAYARGGMGYMFSGCTKLAAIKTGDRFYLPDDEQISTMFSGCSVLTDLGNIQLKESYNEITSLASLFAYSPNLKAMPLVTPEGGTEFTQLRSMKNTFNGLKNLSSIDLSAWKVPVLADVSNMFEGCMSLTNVNLSGWELNNLTAMNSMFAYTGSNDLAVNLSWSGLQQGLNGIQAENILLSRTGNVTLEVGDYTSSEEHRQQMQAIMNAFRAWDAEGNKLTILSNGQPVGEEGTDSTDLSGKTTYTVETYWDGIPDEAQPQTFPATAGDEIAYEAPSVENCTVSVYPAVLIVSEIAENNVIRVNYVTREPEEITVGYTVVYYCNGEEVETVPGSGAVGAVVTEANVDKGITDCHIAETQNLPLTLSENAEDNVIRVYYVSNVSNVVPDASASTSSETGTPESIPPVENPAVPDQPVNNKPANDGKDNGADNNELADGKTDNTATAPSTEEELTADEPGGYVPGDMPVTVSRSVLQFSANAGGDGGVVDENKLTDEDYRLPLTRYPERTPVGSRVQYKVRVCYDGDTGARSGLIDVRFPLPDGVMPVNVNEVEVGNVTFTQGAVRDDNVVVEAPKLEGNAANGWTLTAKLDGLYGGSYIEISFWCTLDREPADQEGSGSCYWDGTAYGATSSGIVQETISSNILRLWDEEPAGTATILYKYFGDSLPSGIVPPETESRKAGEAVTLPSPETVPANYAFLGWYKQASTESTKLTEITIPENVEDGTVIEVYGAWKLVNPPQLTIQYAYSGDVPADAAAPDTLKVENCEIGPSYWPTGLSGVKYYDFGGWKTASVTVNGQASNAYTVRPTGSLDTSQFANAGAGASIVVTYTGGWTPWTGTIRFNKGPAGTDPNSVTGSTESMTEVKLAPTLDTDKTLTPNGFERSGYTFKGWITELGSEKVWEDESNATELKSLIQKKDGVLDLYAVWELNTCKYTVDYYFDDVKGTAPEGAETSGNLPSGERTQVTPDLQVTVGTGESEKHYALKGVQQITVGNDPSQNIVRVDYATDEIGPKGPDGTPDEWQVKVTFQVKDGFWNKTAEDAENSSEPVYCYLTKYIADDDGKLTIPDKEGVASLAKSQIPAVGENPDSSHIADGRWTIGKTDPNNRMYTDPSQEEIAEDMVFVFYYTPKGSMKLMATGYTGVYDGNDHPDLTELKVLDAAGNDVTSQATISYTVDGAPYTRGNVRNVTDKMIHITVSYNNHTTLEQDVSLVINPAPLTITTEGGSMTYSGQPLTNPNYGVEGLVDGEKLVVRTTGSQTAVGSSANNYVIDWTNSTAKEGNYQITSVLGQLVVNDSLPPIIIPTPTPTPTPVNPTPTPTPTPGTTITDEETPLAGAVGLNDTDHFAYIAGYENDTVRPTKNISRAEVATIFFRLMTEEFRVANWATENDLKDVQTADWYNNAVSTCANAGIITGYTDGRFQPQKDITRAEFAVIAARFLGPDADDEGAGDFSDTADHWAAAEIRKAAKAGWITGDGNKFRPNDPITRAEVMVIVNRMLDRTPDAGHMLPDMKTWIDNPEGTWYYEAVQEATNGHDYERDELNVETWTAIQTEKNWKAIEAEWAANNGASAPRDDAEPVEADGESK